MSSERKHIIGLDQSGAPGVPKKAKIHKYTRDQELPPGAVFLSDDQILTKMMDKAGAWKPRSQMWPLTYGTGILAALSAASGLVFNNYIRKRFKLAHFGRYVTYAPTVVIPCIATSFLHYQLIIRPVLIGRYDCPLCVETRSASLQAATGVLQPFLLGILSSSAVAKQRYTVVIPPFSHVNDFLQFYTKTLNKLGGRIVGMLAINVLAAMLITQELGKTSVLLQRAMMSDL